MNLHPRKYIPVTPVIDNQELTQGELSNLMRVQLEVQGFKLVSIPVQGELKLEDRHD